MGCYRVAHRGGQPDQRTAGADYSWTDGLPDERQGILTS